MDTRRPHEETPEEAAARALAREKLLVVKARINEQTERMLTALPADVPKIMHELQRLRVAALTLRELAEDVADPNTYREMALLNKMTGALDLEEDEKRQQQITGEHEAQQRLRDAGIDPEGAAGMLRAFDALRHLMSQPVAEPIMVEEPDGAGADDDGERATTRRRAHA